MLSKLRQQQLTNHLGFWMVLILLAGGLVFRLAGYIKLSDSAFLICLGSGLGWGVSWLFTRETIVKPLKHLLSESEELITKDSLALTDALTALAQGNLTARATLDTRSLDLIGSGEVRQLSKALNAVISQLKSSAKEFNTVTDEPCQRLFYVGSDPYLEGLACGELMGNTLKGQGQIAVITGSFAQTSHQLRRKGFEGILREKYPNVQIMEAVEDHDSAETCYAKTMELIKRHPSLAGIYVGEGGGPYGAAHALVDAGAVGRIKLITHDLVDETMQYVVQGAVTATMGQDPFAQGHDPVIHIFNRSTA